MALHMMQCNCKVTNVRFSMKHILVSWVSRLLAIGSPETYMRVKVATIFVIARVE